MISSLICYAIPEFRILVLYRARASGVVDYGEVGVCLGGGEAHEPPAVVGFHVEAEGGWEVAFSRIMKTNKRFSESAGIRI